MVAEAIYKILTTDAGVSALCGIRVCPDIYLGNVQPAIVYSTVESIKTHAQGATSLKFYTVTIECSASTLIQARQVSAAVRTALTVAAGYYGGITIKRFRMNDGDTDGETIDPQVGDEQTVQYTTKTEYYLTCY